MKRLVFLFFSFLMFSCAGNKARRERNLADDLKHSTFGGLKVVAISERCLGESDMLVKARPDGMGFTTDSVWCTNLEDSLKKIGRSFDAVYETDSSQMHQSCTESVPENQILVTWLFNVYN